MDNEIPGSQMEHACDQAMQGHFMYVCSSSTEAIVSLYLLCCMVFDLQA